MTLWAGCALTLIGFVSALTVSWLDKSGAKKITAGHKLKDAEAGVEEDKTCNGFDITLTLLSSRAAANAVTTVPDFALYIPLRDRGFFSFFSFLFLFLFLLLPPVLIAVHWRVCCV